MKLDKTREYNWESIGKKVRKLRKINKISIDEISKTVGIKHPSNYLQYEKGNSNYLSGIAATSPISL